jgi:hypothetical protein
MPIFSERVNFYFYFLNFPVREDRTPRVERRGGKRKLKHVSRNKSFCFCGEPQTNNWI